MAGHSKWANIKHRKERADAKKGKAFSRVAKEIISAVKTGGADVDSNPRLRLAIQKAKAVNFPNDSIERNIKKASSADQSDFFEFTYELYGHGGVGLIVEVMTDNKNRIAGDMRIATNKRGGTIASPGAVAYQFDRKGVIQVAKEGTGEDDLFMTVSEAGADDFDVEEELYIVLTPPEQLMAVKDAIEGSGAKVLEAEIRMVPQTVVAVDEETAQANQALIDWIEDLDDVDAVYHNMDVD
jgi:YebC/PmpR family DNA-binding regulatory protein